VNLSTGKNSSQTPSDDKRLRILWSVDVEDYYMSPESIPESEWDTGRFEDRIAIGVLRLLQLFREYHAQATWFFLGWIARRHPELVHQVADEGHEIATHTMDHRGMDTLDEKQRNQTVLESRDILQSITGRKVLGLRAPMWSLRRKNVPFFEFLTSQGFLYDSSINPVATYLYGEKGAPRHAYRLVDNPALWEIPPASIHLPGKVFSTGGGFFLRALPLTYMQWAIRRYNSEGAPAVIYVHPWEMDPDHPVPPMPFKQRLIHTFGLHSTQRKMKSLLAQSESMTMEEYARSL
jgi:polysaccharide deacetylase family protein (PEP-CTERM system associated)